MNTPAPNAFSIKRGTLVACQVLGVVAAMASAAIAAWQAAVASEQAKASGRDVELISNAIEALRTDPLVPDLLRLRSTILALDTKDEFDNAARDKVIKLIKDRMTPLAWWFEAEGPDRGATRKGIREACNNVIEVLANAKISKKNKAKLGNEEAGRLTQAKDAVNKAITDYLSK